MSKAYNAHREANSLFSKVSRRQQKRKLKTIIEDIGSRDIPISTILDPEDPKYKGLTHILKENDATLDEIMILGQYAKAIHAQDTKAAEFIRDTKGEKPSTQIDLSSESPLSALSTDELIAMRDRLLEQHATEVVNQDQPQ